MLNLCPPPARQFLARMERPDVDSIEGLSPAISIEQKTTSLIQDLQLAQSQKFMTILGYCRRAGTPICPEHKCSLVKTVNEIVMGYENIEENTYINIFCS